MSKTKLKKYLQTLSHDQILQVVTDLYEARKDAREYLEFYMNPDSGLALEKGKKNVYRNYFTPQGKTRARVSTKSGNDIVADFISLGTGPEEVADLLLYHVEVMMTRLVLRHLVRETAWNSVVSSFRKAIDYITAFNLRPTTERRVEKILDYSLHAPAYLHVNDRLKQEMEECGFESS